MPRLLSLVEEGFEAGVAGTAHREAGAVGEDGEAAVLAVGFDACDALQIHDIRAMDAHEAVWIEAGDGLLLEMLLPLTGQRHVVKFGDGNQRNLRAVLHYEAFQKLLRRPRRGREFVRGRPGCK